MIFIALAVYFVVGTVVAQLLAIKLNGGDMLGDSPAPLFSGFFWPLALPYLLVTGAVNLSHRKLCAYRERKQLPEARVV